MVAKAPTFGADRLIVDLEDGVAPADKVAARNHVRDLGASAAGLVRINAAGSPWHDDDLAMVREARPLGVVLPKAEDPGSVAAIAEVVAGFDGEVALMIETAAGVGRARDLAAAHPAIRTLVYGSADLRRSLGARPDPARGWERHAMSEILLAARMHGRDAIDGVYFEFRDEGGLVRDARIAADLGFDGKSCIHPAQIEPIHRVFASGPDEVAWARAVLDGWKDGDGARRGVVVVDGEMIEALHVDIARRILARTDR